jgi:hypothetical protein
MWLSYILCPLHSRDRRHLLLLFYVDGCYQSLNRSVSFDSVVSLFAMEDRASQRWGMALSFPFEVYVVRKMHLRLVGSRYIEMGQED